MKVNVSNRVKEIEDKLNAKLHVRHLKVIDESEQHVGHAGYQGGGHHFAIEISADELDGLNRVAAHRLVYEALGEMMVRDIHALRIIIIKI